MLVKILRNTVVRMEKDAVVEVSEKEAHRLAAFHNAEIVEEKPEAKPATKKATGKKVGSSARKS